MTLDSNPEAHLQSATIDEGVRFCETQTWRIPYITCSRASRRPPYSAQIGRSTEPKESDQHPPSYRPSDLIRSDLDAPNLKPNQARTIKSEPTVWSPEQNQLLESQSHLKPLHSVFPGRNDKGMMTGSGNGAGFKRLYAPGDHDSYPPDEAPGAPSARQDR
jgi:hypothetical protein